MNANVIGFREKPLKKVKTKSSMNSEMFEQIVPSYLEDLAHSNEKVDRRLYEFIVSQGFKEKTPRSELMEERPQKTPPEETPKNFVTGKENSHEGEQEILCDNNELQDSKIHPAEHFI